MPTVKQVVLDYDKEGKVSSILVHFSEVENAPVICCFSPAIKLPINVADMVFKESEKQQKPVVKKPYDKNKKGKT